MSMLCVCPQFLRKQLVQRRMKKSQGWEVPGKCHCVLGLPFLTEETNRTSNLPEMILWGLNKIEPFLKKHQTVTHCYTECKLGPLSKEQVKRRSGFIIKSREITEWDLATQNVFYEPEVSAWSENLLDMYQNWLKHNLH